MSEDIVSLEHREAQVAELEAEIEQLRNDNRESNQLAADNFTRAKTAEAEIERLRGNPGEATTLRTLLDDARAEIERLKAALRGMVRCYGDHDDPETAEARAAARAALEESHEIS